jgi:hypothetical protein
MKGNVKRQYIQPSFLICVAVLAVSGSAMSVVKSYLGIRMIKKALPLRKSLDLINEENLVPYIVRERQKIDNKDVLEALGTEDYIQWVLENTDAEKNSPLRYCALFVTYYTGNPDRVPHVPEECFFGAGNQRFETEDITFVINATTASTGVEDKPGGRKQRQKIPARCLIFGKKDTDLWQDGSKFPVFYTFQVNGVYRGNRTTTRLALMSNITGKYSYFSKVEWQFYNMILGKRIYPEKEDGIAASEKLLGVVLPILEKDHWPDWQKAMQEG